MMTEAAKELLEKHLEKCRAAIAATGADPDEVLADLRHHVSELVAEDNLDPVTAEDMERILQRIGGPESFATADSAPVSAPPPPPSDPKPQPAPAGNKLYFFSLLFGVILPVATLAIEALTHMCGGVFFDPIPTAWHALVVACVPAANVILWQLARRPSSRLCLWHLVAAGMAVSIAVAYSVLFLPLVVPGVFAIIYFGWGLLPLSPFLSLMVTARLLWVTLWSRDAFTMPRLNGLWIGGVAGVLLVAGVNSPHWLTLYWMRTATMEASESEDVATRSVQRLRQWGHDDTLLRACYENVRGFQGFGSWGWEFGHQAPKSDEARRLYYRVTGKPFNAVPPPQRRYNTARWQFLDDWEWDEALGGTAVAGRVKGLSLLQSRLDGFGDPDTGWSYVEWTMEFKNVSSVAREARAQVALPPGGVVSRLTLWVNGEEREAAFAGTSKVREAYQKVAVVQRRDPVLVTHAGKDRVLMQCFPVPARGGTIKIRMGITAPWHLLSEDQAALRLPCFLERNFRVPNHVQHAVWLEYPRPFTVGSATLTEDRSKPDVHALHGRMSDAQLTDPLNTVRSSRDPSVQASWRRLKGEEEPGAEAGTARAVVRQMASDVVAAPVNRVVVVIDGSVGMDRWLPEIAEGLGILATTTELAVLLARDGVHEVIPVDHDAVQREALVNRIAQIRPAGGQDNQPALLRAWDLAAAVENGVVVWFHGPQPVMFDRLEPLAQRLLWRPDQDAVVWDVATYPSPNRLLETREFAAHLAPLPRLGELSDDLKGLMQQLSGEKRWRFVRELVDDDAIAASGKQGSSHLARLWANEEVGRLVGSEKNARKKAVELACNYQLVTPVSGAVVLETAEQFEEAGLEPVDGDSVPTVPEPGTWVLMILGAGGLLMTRRRRRFRKS